MMALRGIERQPDGVVRRDAPERKPAGGTTTRPCRRRSRPDTDYRLRIHSPRTSPAAQPGARSNWSCLRRCCLPPETRCFAIVAILFQIVTPHCTPWVHVLRGGHSPTKQSRDRYARPLRESPTPRSHGGVGYVRTPCASGVAAGARHGVRRRWPMRSDPNSHRCSAPFRSLASRRWPARPRGTGGYRCRAGRARSWPNRRSPTESAGRYRRRRYAGGCRRTLSNRGSPGRRSSSPTQTLPSRPNGYSTSTPACGTGNRWAATTT